MQTRICIKCNEEKEITKFNRFFRKGKEYHEHTCYSCRQKLWRQNPENLSKAVKRTKEWYEKNKSYVKRDKRDRDLKRLYGIGEVDFNEMLAKQEGKCKICKKPQTEEKYLHVDHCHDTKKIRGLLCTKCNTGLGLFCESAELLEKAKEYLTEHKT